MNSCEKTSEITKLEKKIAHEKGIILELSAFLSLDVGDRVTDSQKLGAIANLSLSNGGLPEVWVSWYGLNEIESSVFDKIEDFYFDF